MDTFKTETTVKKDHLIEIENVPFENGEKVEVIVSKKEAKGNESYSLRGTLIKYIDPFEPVAEEDWEALKIIT